MRKTYFTAGYWAGQTLKRAALVVVVVEMTLLRRHCADIGAVASEVLSEVFGGKDAEEADRGSFWVFFEIALEC